MEGQLSKKATIRPSARRSIFDERIGDLAPIEDDETDYVWIADNSRNLERTATWLAERIRYRQRKLYFRFGLRLGVMSGDGGIVANRQDTSAKGKFPNRTRRIAAGRLGGRYQMIK